MRSVERVLGNLAVLHDDDEVLQGISNEIEVLERIAIHQNQVGGGTLLDDADLQSEPLPTAPRKRSLQIGNF